MPRIDRDASLNIANRSLGALSDLVSQFKVNMVPNVGKDAQINYKNTPVRVVPLEYANLIKWFTNRSNGLPGYIVVDLVTQSAEVKRVEGGIKYTTAEHFNRYLMRHLRFQYPTFMFAEPNFEINEAGEPTGFARLRIKPLAYSAARILRARCSSMQQRARAATTPWTN